MVNDHALDALKAHDEFMRGVQNRNWSIGEAQLALPRLLSGEATWVALQTAVSDLVSRAPKDHDVLVQAFGLIVTKIQFVAPHTFIFEGFDSAGHQAGLVAHFTQVIASVVYLPKRGPERIITGFGKGAPVD